MLTLTRKVTFYAGHVYRGGGMSRAELDAMFGVEEEFDYSATSNSSAAATADAAAA